MTESNLRASRVNHWLPVFDFIVRQEGGLHQTWCEMTERAIGSSSECRKSDHPIIILDNHNEKMHMYQSGNLFHVVLMRFLEKKKTWAPFLAKNCRSINQARVWSLHRLQRCESVKSQIWLQICIFGWRENFWSKRERAFEILRNTELVFKSRKRIRGWFCCFALTEKHEIQNNGIIQPKERWNKKISLDVCSSVSLRWIPPKVWILSLVSDWGCGGERWAGEITAFTLSFSQKYKNKSTRIEIHRNVQP